MPISQTDQLFSLIKALTPAEKRNFRLFAKRAYSNHDQLFIRLFDSLEKTKQYDESSLLKRLGNISKTQFSNAKRNLYTQIISSLRLLHKDKRANFKVREYIDYAYILYGKGLYIQALKILEKAKTIAKRHHLIYMQLTIVELQKTIETRHITRSGSNVAHELINESQMIQESANHLVKLSNLRIKMHSKYLEYGHVRNETEANDIEHYYLEEIKDIIPQHLSLMERIFYVQSRVWYNYILLRFDTCLQYAVQWVNLLQDNPAIIERDVDLYLRGYHYILTCAIHTEDVAVHSEYLQKFETFRSAAYGTFNTNSQILSFLYVHTGRLDSLMLQGNFGKADTTILKSLSRIKRYGYKLDDHRIMVFYFKFAWIYLGAGEPAKALHYLNQINNNRLKKLREDLQNYARLLQLMCHYELENFDILQYLINTYDNYFRHKKNLNVFTKVAMQMFSEIKSKGPMDHKLIFERYHERFEITLDTPYEKRALAYIDMISWLESKIKGITLQDVIQMKAANRVRNTS